MQRDRMLEIRSERGYSVTPTGWLYAHRWRLPSRSSNPDSVFAARC